MHTLQSPHSPLLQHGQLLSMQVQHPHALHGGGGGHNNGLRGIPLGVPNGFQVVANQAGHPQALGQGQHLMHAGAGLAAAHGVHGASNGTFGSFSSMQQAMGGGATEYGGQGGAHPNPVFPKYVRPQPHSKVPQPTSVPRTDDCIRDVWAHNLEDEMRRISDIVERYPFISMDTEFPGVVVHPLQSGSYAGSNFSHMWKTIQCNVNILKIIQLGLTFSDEHGRVPDGVCTWQFNFKFDIDLDMYAQDSIELLQASGLDFAKHSSDGIDVHSFGELLTASGLVLNEEVRWVSFHSGYDFGYIIRVLTNAELPEDESEFFELLDTYFNCVYDIKYVVKSCSELNHKAGLNQLAADLLIERIGPCHQAGSDSLITCLAFFKMIKNYATDFSLDDAKWKNVLYGLGRDNL